MRVISIDFLEGINIYHSSSVLRLHVDFGSEYNNEIFRINKQNTEFLNHLLKKISKNKNFISFENYNIIDKKNLLLLTSILIQKYVGDYVGYVNCIKKSNDNSYLIIIEYKRKDVGRKSALIALQVIKLVSENIDQTSVNFSDFDFTKLEKLRSWILGSSVPGLNSSFILERASKRRIPYKILDKQTIILGHGNRRRFVISTSSDDLGLANYRLSRNKIQTANVLRDAGMPVPNQEIVHSEDQALRAAEKIGFPVVIKPMTGNEGIGVTANVSGQADVARAFKKLRSKKNIIVESFAEGFDHRILIIDNKFVAAAKRISAHVVGDGDNDIEKLVKIENGIRRNRGRKNEYNLRLDESSLEEIARQGYTSQSVPKNGEVVFLSSASNYSRGGTAHDVTSIVHPANTALAIRVAKTMGIDVCGVDFITQDISRDYNEVGGIICEVNAGPGFLVHLQPDEGKARDVVTPLLDLVFPDGNDGRIPAIALTGVTEASLAVAKLISKALVSQDQTVGIAVSGKTYINGQQVNAGAFSCTDAIKQLLSDGTISTIVICAEMSEISEFGLGYENLSLFAPFSSDYNSKNKHTNDKFLSIIRTISNVKECKLIINAKNKYIYELYNKNEQVYLYNIGSKCDLLKKHVAKGGSYCTVDDCGESLLFKINCNEDIHHDIVVNKPINFNISDDRMELCCIYIGLLKMIGFQVDNLQNDLNNLIQLDSSLFYKKINSTKISQDRKHENNAKDNMWSLNEVIKLSNGKLSGNKEQESEFSGVSYYLGQIKKGDIAITTDPMEWNASKYKNTNLSINRMFEKGASLVIASDDKIARDIDTGPVVVVDNTLDVLINMGEYARNRSSASIIGVTGTAGKTTTKSFVEYLLSRQGKTKGSRKNFNNLPGVALMLAETPKDTEFGVYEFAVDLPHLTKRKSKMLRPHVALITNIDTDHLHVYKTLEELTDQKCIIFDNISSDGVVVLNRNSKLFERQLSNAKKKKINNIITFGKDEESDIRIKNFNMNETNSRVTVEIFRETYKYVVPHPGKHMVMNSLAALAVVKAVGADIRMAIEHIADMPAMPQRNEIHSVQVGGGEAKLIDDTFSANPASAEAGLSLLGLMPVAENRRKIAIIGEMKELGEYSEEAHVRLAPAVVDAGVDLLLTIGEDIGPLAQALGKNISSLHTNDPEEICKVVSAELRPGDIIWVKGSRRTPANLEKIISTIKSLCASNSKITEHFARTALETAKNSYKILDQPETLFSNRFQSINFGGDTSLGDYYLQYPKLAKQKIRLENEPESFFNKLGKIIPPSDLNILNLETVLLHDRSAVEPLPKEYPGWDNPDRTLRILKRLGVNAVSVANNHTNDFGQTCLINSINSLRQNNIATFGAGESAASACRPLILRNKLRNVYVFGAMEFRRFYRNELDYYANETAAGVCLLDDRIKFEIRSIRERDKKSIIIVTPHWGSNYRQANSRMYRAANELLESGANIIIGHGPHMLCTCEADERGVKLFSIGNAVFNSPGRYSQYDVPPYSAIVRIIMPNEIINSKIKVRIYPIISDNKITNFGSRPTNELEFRDVVNYLISLSKNKLKFSEKFIYNQDDRGYFIQTNIDI